MAAQKRCRSSRRATGGRPGECIRTRSARSDRLCFGRGIASPWQVLRGPLEPGQYTSTEFRAVLKTHHGVQSLSRKGQCWDNAVGESWFATLKEELIHRQAWATISQVRRAVIGFIEIFYNRQRLHSSLGYLTPVEYEL